VEYTNDMGLMFKKKRLEANLTQEGLAEKIGVSSRYIMAIENEGKRPSLDIWFRLIRILHISADAIIYPETLPSEDDQLLRMYRLLQERDRKIIQAVMKSMLELPPSEPEQP